MAKLFIIIISKTIYHDVYGYTQDYLLKILLLESILIGIIILVIYAIFWQNKTPIFKARIIKL